jgi:hypothetical protein
VCERVLVRRPYGVVVKRRAACEIGRIGVAVTRFPANNSQIAAQAEFSLTPGQGRRNGIIPHRAYGRSGDAGGPPERMLLGK